MLAGLDCSNDLLPPLYSLARAPRTDSIVQARLSARIGRRTLDLQRPPHFVHDDRFHLSGCDTISRFVSVFRYLEKMSSRYAYIVHFTDEELNDLKSALKASKLAKPTWESSENAKGEWGISSAWMKEAKRVWENEFDWFVDSFYLFPSLHETYLATCRLDRRKQERR